jgi:hypothetical protein
MFLCYTKTPNKGREATLRTTGPRERLDRLGRLVYDIVVVSRVQDLLRSLGLFRDRRKGVMLSADGQ